MELRVFVNGAETRLDTDAGRRLIDILRDDLRLTGAKEGCGEGECGACTVLLDGHPVYSCLTLALQIQGRQVDTIEGLNANGALHPLQTAFVDETAIQCGACTGGMIMSAKALLARIPDPTEADIRDALSGHICRCSGYSQIIRAIQRVAASHTTETAE